MPKNENKKSFSESEIINSLIFHHDALLTRFTESTKNGCHIFSKWDLEKLSNLPDGDLLTWFLQEWKNSYCFDVSLYEFTEFGVYSKGASKGTEKREDYGYLMILLGRSLAFCKKLITNICVNNIGESVIAESNPLQSMEDAFKWMFIQSTQSEDLSYQDIQRLKRLLWYQFFHFDNYLSACGRKKTKDYGEVERAFTSACKDLQRSDSEEKRIYINWYKQNMESLIGETFSALKALSVYYDYMVQTSAAAFEEAWREKHGNNGELRMRYEDIGALARNIQNILVRHFSSAVKIGAINAPHIRLTRSDFVSSDLSGSNLINSDFSYSDISGSFMRGCDISSSNLRYLRARNTDFTGSTLSSAILSGSSFQNANLTNAQLLDVIFRNPAFDFVTTENLKSGKECFDEAQRPQWVRYLEIKEQAQKSAPERTAIDESDEDSSRTFDYIDDQRKKTYQGLQALSRAQQDPEQGRFTDLWLATTSNIRAFPERRLQSVSVGANMEKACELMKDVISGLADAVSYFTVPGGLVETVDRNLSNPGMRSQVASFVNSIFTGAAVFDTDFSLVDMSSVTMDGADASSSISCYTKLSNASLRGSNLSNSYFCAVACDNAVFAQTNLIGSSFINCDLKGANFTGSIQIDALHISTDLQKGTACYIGGLFAPPAVGELTETVNSATENVSQSGVSYIDANFNETTATGSRFIGVNADRSSWIGAKLKQTVFFDMLIRWAYLDGADCSYSVFCGVSMHQSSLANILFPQSRLFACDLSGTRLRGANFTGSRLDQVFFEDSDLSTVNFSRSSIFDCVFKDVNFNLTNLTGAEFFNVVFINVDFTTCIGLESARFSHCIFGKGCSKLVYPMDSNHQQDKSFMSLQFGDSRLKFFRDDEQAEEMERTYGVGRYTSLTALL